MKLDKSESRHRLQTHEHGVLATVHPTRGVDAVPVVYAVDAEGYVGIPIDRVKPKASNRLQRQRNLELDNRATLLVEHWDRNDWTKLWWVRAELRWQESDLHRAEGLADLLVDRFEHYADRPFTEIMVLKVVDVTGWAAEG